jgi:DNA-binding NarL/FixJ family response regulator
MRKKTPPAVRLTAAQMKILKLLLRGLSDAQIARHVRRSIHTVRVHVQVLLRKYSVRSRAALIVAVLARTKPVGKRSHVHECKTCGARFL